MNNTGIFTSLHLACLLQSNVFTRIYLTKKKETKQKEQPDAKYWAASENEDELEKYKLIHTHTDAIAR